MTTQNLPARTDDFDDLDTGLEDFKPEEATIPRLGIAHADGVFKDNLTGEQFAEMYGVILGLVKQRVMWPAELGDDGQPPQCKSSDAATGYPNMDNRSGIGFPWAESGLDASSLPVDTAGRVTIACEACPFSQWTKGVGKNIPPRCSERHTFPILFNTDSPDGPWDRAGIISFQRSGLTPSKRYLSAFSHSKQPLYSVVTKLTLTRQQRGTVKYSVPVFSKVADVDRDEWPEYSTQYRGLREFLRRGPRSDEDGDDAKKQTISGNVGAVNVAATVQQSAPVAATSVVQQATAPVVTAEVMDDDDLPF